MSCIIGGKESTTVTRPTEHSVRIIYTHVPFCYTGICIYRNGRTDIPICTFQPLVVRSVGNTAQACVDVIIERDFPNLKRRPVQPFIQRIGHCHLLRIGNIKALLILEVDGVIHPFSGSYQTIRTKTRRTVDFIRIPRLLAGILLRII